MSPVGSLSEFLDRVGQVVNRRPRWPDGSRDAHRCPPPQAGDDEIAAWRQILDQAKKSRA